MTDYFTHADAKEDWEHEDATIDAATEPQAQLDETQQAAITLASRELYTDISGTAGVGKTYVARELQRRVPGTTILAATTGIASVNLGEGTTVNSLLRYFDTKSLIESYRTGMLQAQIRRLRRAGVQRILIDEKSMMAGQQLTPIARAIREVNEGGIYALEDVGVGENEDDPMPLSGRDRDLPPMGLTLVGDFGQLPPVPDKEVCIKSGKEKVRNLPVEFAFDSPEWPLFAENRTILTTIYRQDAQDFVAALHAVRKGDVRSALEFFTPNRFSESTDENFNGTTIFAKNDAVERHNMLKLDGLRTPAMTVKATRIGKQRGDWKLIPDELRLKEQALVMILANRREYEDEEDDRGRMVYANGDLGVLVGKDDSGAWLVTLQRTGRNVRVLPVTRENTIPLEPGRRKELIAEGKSLIEVITEKGKGKSEIIGSITYLPLRAAYAATVHKTQGLTLDRVQVNLRDPFFRQPGMLFVALSRARTAEGLRIVGNQTGMVERCKLEPRVLPWL